MCLKPAFQPHITWICLFTRQCTTCKPKRIQQQVQDATNQSSICAVKCHPQVCGAMASFMARASQSVGHVTGHFRRFRNVRSTHFHLVRSPGPKQPSTSPLCPLKTSQGCHTPGPEKNPMTSWSDKNWSYVFEASESLKSWSYSTYSKLIIVN